MILQHSVHLVKMSHMVFLSLSDAFCNVNNNLLRRSHDDRILKKTQRARENQAESRGLIMLKSDDTE